MLSDESSSDSETGRFKCRTKPQDETTQASKARDSNFRLSKDNLKPSERSRRHENERYHKDFERRRDEREILAYRTKERHRYSRHSPVRRRRSHERSKHREHYERPERRHGRDSREQSKDHRSNSKDRVRRSESKTRKSPNHSKYTREVVNSHVIEKKSEKSVVSRENRSPSIENRMKRSLSSDRKLKKSEVHKASLEQPVQKSTSPVIVEVHGESDEFEEVKPGSYYNMIPAVIVKEKSEESSEIDSSDDERLRAKLLNLEKEINKTKKKKHKKKHKKKGSKNKDKMQEATASVEVSSTTDIQATTANNKTSGSETAEVTSTQKNFQKESSEEGEILSDDDPQSPINIDSNDLRHKLKRSTMQANKLDICGPALPPHLEKRNDGSSSPDREGPELPPHLQKKPRQLGPSIPQDMRKVLEEKSQDVIRFDSSDEDVCVVGPLPTGSEAKWTHAHKRLEERALDMKLKKMDGHSLSNVDIKSREKWMLELPEGKAKYLGLEARSFRAKEGPDMSDRSSWTDTPEEKARKVAGLMKEEDADAALHREARSKQIANRDEEQETAIKKHKKKQKRDESLMEMHQKKLKKKKKKDEKGDEKPERRPFSRDIDLQVNRFDEAQKKSIIKKAQALDSRFSRGEAKYL